MWDMTFTFRDDENQTSQVTLHFTDSIAIAYAHSAALATLVFVGQ